MMQVLFWIPIKTGLTPNGIPIYGFGTMLFLAFVASMWVAVRRANKEGVSQDRLFDLAIWVFVAGIIGARIVFMIQYEVPLRDWYKFWQGGIVFYGSAIGGWIGYALAWFLSFKKYRISTMKLADIVAPAVCIGLMVGRIGCFMNGCCYGHICTDYGLAYPLMTAPSRDLVVNQGYQTAAGFTLDESSYAMMDAGPAIVGAVEPGSAAAEAGLRSGDIIKKVNNEPIDNVHQLRRLFLDNWPRGKTEVAMDVIRGSATIAIAPFTPRSLRLHPTQIYESISMALLFFLILAFLPYRKRYGEAFVVLMLGYAVHRFFNETLRDDTAPVFMNLTLSQVGSLGVFAAGIGLETYLRLFTPPISATQSESGDPNQGSKQSPASVQPEVAK
jgi:phosphatidylglycerol:prolipoprotein diacylglycerol transferase